MGEVFFVTELVKIVGERIRMYRTRMNLSQDGLGEKAGLHGKYIGQLERGEKNATLESIGKVAIALDVPLEVLFERIVLGDTRNDILSEVYELLTPLPEKDQSAMLALIKKAMDYKNT